ncbi:MAG: NYN domain-containing protein [Chloroflexi bacterium]|nr:NYN domain-containing protein [Chloroflexota bacterium]
MTDRSKTVVMLIDWDNLQICHSRDAPGTDLDLHALIALAQSYGTLVSARAYAEWNLLSERMAVYKAGIEPVFAPVMRPEGSIREGKSLADTVMVADGVDLLWTVAPDVFVLVTSDKDMIPLARIAKQRGAAVVILGSDLTAIPLVEISNVFITYRQLLRELDRVSELDAPSGRAPARERRPGRETRRPSSQPYTGPGLREAPAAPSRSLSAPSPVSVGFGGPPPAPRRVEQVTRAVPAAIAPAPLAPATITPTPLASSEAAEAELLPTIATSPSDAPSRRRRRRGGRGRRGTSTEPLGDETLAQAHETEEHEADRQEAAQHEAERHDVERHDVERHGVERHESHRREPRRHEPEPRAESQEAVVPPPDDFDSAVLELLASRTPAAEAPGAEEPPRETHLGAQPPQPLGETAEAPPAPSRRVRLERRRATPRPAPTTFSGFGPLDFSPTAPFTPLPSSPSHAAELPAPTFEAAEAGPIEVDPIAAETPEAPSRGEDTTNVAPLTLEAPVASAPETEANAAAEGVTTTWGTAGAEVNQPGEIGAAGAVTAAEQPTSEAAIGDRASTSAAGEAAVASPKPRRRTRRPSTRAKKAPAADAPGDAADAPGDAADGSSPAAEGSNPAGES